VCDDNLVAINSLPDAESPLFDMFATDRTLVNPKFEGYKLDAVDQDDCVARHSLQYIATQSTVSTNSPLSFQEVQSRITHNHISVAPDDPRAVYIDAQYRVILIELHPVSNPPLENRSTISFAIGNAYTFV
jgi:hypothetical protein